ncbi:MAG: ATP-binding cassette domain-containing protein [Clostridia bacterium]|nr:ATP-binding cassette domain-containing protein [Clostridia bacterium]
MGWFDEQICQRKANDQELFEDALLDMASVVLGKKRAGMQDRDESQRAALDDILKYYRLKPAAVPDSIRDAEERMEYCLRPHGIMQRAVRLERGWHREAYGPMLGYRKDDGTAAAILPGRFGGYRVRDPESGRWTLVKRKTEECFREDALCFYRPLPQRALGVSDLFLYMKDCLSAGDHALIVFLTAAVSLVGLLLPAVTHAMTGFVYESGKVPMLVGAGVFLLAAHTSALLFRVARELGVQRIWMKTSLSLESAMMVRLLTLPVRFFRQFSSGELANRFGAVNKLCSLLIGSVYSAGLSALLSLLYMTQIFRFAPELVLPVLAVLLAMILIAAVSAVIRMRWSRMQNEKEAEDAGISYALITGVQKIRMAGAEKRAFAKWAKSYAQTADVTYNTPLFLTVGGALMTAVGLIGTIVLYGMAVKSGVSPSEYIAFNTAYGMVSGAFAALASVAQSAAKIPPILEMAEPILKTVPEISENRTGVTKLSGSVELSGVSFRYDEASPWILNGVNLKIRAGEYIAVVGKSGCGKSTLMRLLLGFEVPERGAVFYDGRDLAKLDPQSLRRRIGTVTQNDCLFEGDIFSNIAVAAPDLTLEGAWEAAQIAGIADDIRAMPLGMKTIIGEGQGGISGGQKQRLMIARAIASSPDILMFDEATSALDNRTQKQISDALDALKCTRILIAHRLSTIRNCDRIIVLSDGRIAEDGTYEELIAKNGIFAGLAARQQADPS